uniref:EOG090X02ZJ n=1 Tax=Evadne anonyx TaxID=141404 RepID=A0A9N6ZF82_9CRUS|nr:EOG090X02ZJ [Evadne anonyx]
MSMRIVVWLVAALLVVAVSGRATPSSARSENDTGDHFQVDFSGDQSGNYTSDYLGALSRRSRRGAINTDILRQHLKQALSKCNSREPPPMHKVLLKDKNAVCNDGSSAGYFIRKSYGSKRWIIFLEGGWYCYDKRSCEARWSRLRGFMTSKMWPNTRQVNGILSPDPEENPYWWNANHVYVPYCSSDSWSGSSPAGSNSRFAFMGSVILMEVIRDLLPQGLLNASKLMLTGSSAGGIGVLLNLDRVTDFLRMQGAAPEVRGVTDSGWFLDNVPYAPADCQDPQRCAPTTVVQLGHALWNGQIPSTCRAHHASQPWRCYFGYHLHKTLKTPLFIFQWLFDEAQMTADNVGPPMSKEQWDYIHAVGDDLRRTFANVTAVFSPSCISHTVLTKRDWQNIRIGDISLPRALRCWELQPYWSVSNHMTHDVSTDVIVTSPLAEEENVASVHPLRHSHKRYKAANLESNPIVLLADDPEMPSSGAGTVKPARTLVRSGQRRLTVGSEVQTTNITLTATSRQPARNGTHHRRKQGRRKIQGRKRNRKTQQQQQPEKVTEKVHRRKQQKEGKVSNRSSNHRRNNKERKRKKAAHSDKAQRQETTTRPRRQVLPAEASPPEFCQHRLVDRCTWPQCNRACPKLHNPFTGEEMDFIQLLKSFGLDMSSVANALGIDMHTLNNMDHDVLLHLLTQQTN